MSNSRHSPTRTIAGTFPGGSGAAGVFPTTHGKGDRGLTAARAVLAQVSNCTDLQIARACQIILNRQHTEPQERADARALLDRIPMVVLAQLDATEARGADA